MVLFNLKCIWGSSLMPSISDPMEIPGTEKGEGLSAGLEEPQTWISSTALATAKLLLFGLYSLTQVLTLALSWSIFFFLGCWAWVVNLPARKSIYIFQLRFPNASIPSCSRKEVGTPSQRLYVLMPTPNKINALFYLFTPIWPQFLGLEAPACHA